jgi:hypothetical protein
MLPAIMAVKIFPIDVHRHVIALDNMVPAMTKFKFHNFLPGYEYSDEKHDYKKQYPGKRFILWFHGFGLQEFDTRPRRYNKKAPLG